MPDVALIETVLAKDLTLLEGVREEQLAGPTPCADYDVAALVQHVVASARFFEGSATGMPSGVDFGTFHSDQPVQEFTGAAERLVAGWREHGTDRTVELMGGQVPSAQVLNMTIMEFVTHGCDLALATGQPVPFTDAELETTLDRARTTLPDAYRGPGRGFDAQVEVAGDAPALARLLGFMGRAQSFL